MRRPTAILAAVIVMVAASVCSAQDYNSSVVRDGAVDPFLAAADSSSALICPPDTIARTTEDALQARLDAWFAELGDADVSRATPLALRETPPALQYPRRASKGFQRGLVVVVMLVEKDGSVRESLVTCSSDPFFEASAVEFTSRLRYQPATLDGVPIRSSARQPIDFGGTPASGAR